MGHNLAAALARSQGVPVASTGQRAAAGMAQLGLGKAPGLGQQETGAGHVKVPFVSSCFHSMSLTQVT